MMPTLSPLVVLQVVMPKNTCSSVSDNKVVSIKTLGFLCRCFKGQLSHIPTDLIGWLGASCVASGVKK